MVQRVHGEVGTRLGFATFPRCRFTSARAAGRRFFGVWPTGVRPGTELPIRMLLLQLGRRTPLDAPILHHIVFDGASRLVLLRDLSASYAGLATGGDGGLPPLALQAADISGWQGSNARGLLSRDESLKSSLAGVVGGTGAASGFRRPGPVSLCRGHRVRDLDPALRGVC